MCVTCNIPDTVCPGQRKGKSLGQSWGGSFLVRSGSVFCLFMHCLTMSKEGQNVLGKFFVKGGRQIPSSGSA